MRPPERKLPSTPDWGGFFNYGVFASRVGGSEGTDPLSAAFTTSLFGPAGVGTLSALVNPQGQGARDFVVLDASWRWDDVRKMTTTIVGDSISAPGWWGRPIRFGGIQYSSNFALQPNFVSTPLLAVSGLAGLPSTTEILANNVRVGTQDVPAGPFTISNIPTVTGAGELQLVVRDAFGQQRVITQPFYVASQLLRPGVSQFSLSAGAARFDYGLRNFEYGSGYATGWYRAGIDEITTGEARIEADSSGAAAGVGLDALLGQLGVLSMGLSASHADSGNGRRTLLGFDRSSPFFSFAIRSTWASRQYREIGDEGPKVHRSSTAIAQVPMANGSFALAWTGLSYHNAAPFDVYSATYTVPIAGRVYASLALSRSLSMGTHQTTALALVTIPLGERTSASASIQTNRVNGAQDTRAEAAVQRGLPLGEGIGYYLRGSSDRQRSGGFSYAGAYGRYGAEVYANDTSTSVRANVTGGIAWLGDTAVLTRPIEQSFALVDTAGIPGVRVLQENNEVGRTSARGRLMLTDVPPYSEIRIAVDPLTVPMDVTLPETVTAHRDTAPHRPDCSFRREAGAQRRGPARVPRRRSGPTRRRRDHRRPTGPVPGRHGRRGLLAGSRRAADDPGAFERQVLPTRSARPGGERRRGRHRPAHLHSHDHFGAAMRIHDLHASRLVAALALLLMSQSDALAQVACSLSVTPLTFGAYTGAQVQDHRDGRPDLQRAGGVAACLHHHGLTGHLRQLRPALSPEGADAGRNPQLHPHDCARQQQDARSGAMVPAARPRGAGRRSRSTRATHSASPAPPSPGRSPPGRSRPPGSYSDTIIVTATWN